MTSSANKLWQTGAAIYLLTVRGRLGVWRHAAGKPQAEPPRVSGNDAIATVQQGGAVN